MEWRFCKGFGVGQGSVRAFPESFLGKNFENLEFSIFYEKTSRIPYFLRYLVGY